MMLSALTLALMLPFAKPIDDLKIEDIKVGEGVEAKPFDVVEVHYIGKLTNGTEFDSSIKKGAVLRFQLGVGRVIKGWDQGILGMKPGGERNLTVPPALGYGSKAMGDTIPANSTLNFYVKLVRVLPSVKVEILTPGTGEGLKLGQDLECRISMKLPSGKEIADPKILSHIHIDPRIIPGINQALAGIKAGEKRKVLIGYQLAWGDLGVPSSDVGEKKAGSDVPPRSDITMEIEAVKITA